MKLTWFGAGAYRVQIGGKIFVIRPEMALDEFDTAELVSGADRVIDAGDVPLLPEYQPATSKERRSLLEADEDGNEPACYRLGADHVFVHADDEPSVLLASISPLAWGRWADGCVIVFDDGDDLVERVDSLLGAARPRLIGLALDDPDCVSFDDLAEKAGGTPMQVLDLALAVEV